MIEINKENEPKFIEQLGDRYVRVEDIAYIELGGTVHRCVTEIDYPYKEKDHECKVAQAIDYITETSVNVVVEYELWAGKCTKVVIKPTLFHELLEKEIVDSFDWFEAYGCVTFRYGDQRRVYDTESGKLIIEYTLDKEPHGSFVSTVTIEDLCLENEQQFIEQCKEPYQRVGYMVLIGENKPVYMDKIRKRYIEYGYGVKELVKFINENSVGVTAKNKPLFGIDFLHVVCEFPSEELEKECRKLASIFDCDIKIYFEYYRDIDCNTKTHNSTAWSSEDPEVLEDIRKATNMLRGEGTINFIDHRDKTYVLGKGRITVEKKEPVYTQEQAAKELHEMEFFEEHNSYLVTTEFCDRFIEKLATTPVRDLYAAENKKSKRFACEIAMGDMFKHNVRYVFEFRRGADDLNAIESAVFSAKCNRSFERLVAESHKIIMEALLSEGGLVKK